MIPLKKKKRADRLPGTFLLGSAHICWFSRHHRAALKPLEEAEALATSVFNGRCLGHKSADAGGSGLTFFPYHPKSYSNTAPIKTFPFQHNKDRTRFKSFRCPFSPLLNHLIYSEVFTTMKCALFNTHLNHRGNKRWVFHISSKIITTLSL